MIDISFNTRNNGACPMCRKRNDCHLLKSLEITVKNEALEKFDNKMEIVIYRCPEFEEV